MHTRSSKNLLTAASFAFTVSVLLCLLVTSPVAADNHDNPTPENETKTAYQTELLATEAGSGISNVITLDSGGVLVAGPSGEEFGDEGVGRANSGPELRRYDANGELVWRTDVSLRPQSSLREGIVSLDRTHDGQFITVMQQNSRTASVSAYIARVVEVTGNGQIVRSRTMHTLRGSEFNGIQVGLSDATVTENGTVVAVGDVFVNSDESHALSVFIYPDNETEHRLIDRGAVDELHTVRITENGRFVGLYIQRGPDWPQADVAHYRARFSSRNFETEPLPRLDQRYGNGTGENIDGTILSTYRNDIENGYVFATVNKTTRKDEVAGFVVLDEAFRPVDQLSFPSYAEPREGYNVTRSDIYSVRRSTEETYLVAGRTRWWEDYSINIDGSEADNYRRGWVVEVDYSDSSSTILPIIDESNTTFTGVEQTGADTFTVVGTYFHPEIPGVQSRIYRITPEQEPVSTATGPPEDTSPESANAIDNAKPADETDSGFIFVVAFVAIAAIVVMLHRLR